MNAIEIYNLTKLYGKILAVDKIYLNVKQGEIFGFIGPNGAGKSTTIRTLLNLIYPSSGKAKIFGMDIIKKTKDIKKIVGYLPAEGSYYHKLNAKELFDYSAKYYGIKDYSDRLNYLVEMLDKSFHKTKDVETYLDLPVLVAIPSIKIKENKFPNKNIKRRSIASE